MTRIPLPALVVGWAGLVPFLYGVALILFADELELPVFGLAGTPREGGVLILRNFGAVILGFMGGCLWGFSSAAGRHPTFLQLGGAALPALLAALALRPSAAVSCIWLAFGFVVLQAIDLLYHRAGVAPQYWLHLRLPLTAGVMTCLLIGALFG
jgi:hypothetical protein